MNKEDLIKKYEGLEGVWDANGAEIARQCFLRDLEQLNEINTKKVTVPQYVADWIEEAKKEGYSILGAINKAPKGEVEGWLELQNVEIFAEAWVNGHEIEKEKLYYVRLKNVDENYNYLTNIKHLNAWSLTEIKTDKKFRSQHTRQELEGGGFGEVFNSPLFEVEEVEK